MYISRQYHAKRNSLLALYSWDDVLLVLLFTIFNVSTGVIVAAGFFFLFLHATERPRVSVRAFSPWGHQWQLIMCHSDVPQNNSDLSSGLWDDVPPRAERKSPQYGLAKLPCPCWNPFGCLKGCSIISGSWVTQKAMWSKTFCFQK